VAPALGAVYSPVWSSTSAPGAHVIDFRHDRVLFIPILVTKIRDMWRSAGDYRNGAHNFPVTRLK
jgi:hypothetical protein